MRRFYLLLLLLACFPLNGAEPTNNLCIYLLASKADVKAALNGQANLSSITLEPEPILADHDFTSYDAKTGKFFIKSEAAKRLSGKLLAPIVEPRVQGSLGLGYEFDGRDTPFVLTAMNERIYIGVFSSLLSSMTYGCPVIMPDDTCIPASSTNDLGFGFRPAVDDKRIIAAVEKLSLTNKSPRKSPLK